MSYIECIYTHSACHESYSFDYSVQVTFWYTTLPYFFRMLFYFFLNKTNAVNRDQCKDVRYSLFLKIVHQFQGYISVTIG